ncbi:hypothetical protein K7432_017307 [Basidiobolus ranarum]|uniref:Uncharacterized protein n=1 Tax=Basidiobolus ranarum TaxID=34480 RepID=A0ABR2VKJ3_9FUNG
MSTEAAKRLEKSDSSNTITTIHIINQILSELRNVIPQKSGDKRTLPQASTPPPAELIEYFKNVPEVVHENTLKEYARTGFGNFQDSRILNECLGTYNKSSPKNGKPINDFLLSEIFSETPFL